MQSTPHPMRSVRFGVFEVDFEAGELRKSGFKVALQEQPFLVLTLLLENAGKLVSRDELQQKIWAADTFVEFDRGLNTAINKVRDALGDSAGNPRFIETVPRRGYRFLGPVETVGDATAGQERAEPKGRWSFLAAALLVLLIIGGVWFRFSHRFAVLPTPPLRIVPLTGYGWEGAPTFSPD